MSNEAKRPKRPGEEDSWETLAEDLFGIDFGKTAARVEPPANNDISTVVTDDSSPAAGEEPTKTGSDEAIAAVDVQEGFAAEIEDGSAEAEGDFEEPEEDLAVAESGEVASEPEAPEPEKSDDDYWDALSDWDWDNERFADDVPDAEGEIPTPPPRRSPPPARRNAPARPSERETRRRSTATASPAPQQRSTSTSRDDFIDNDDFGLGVIEEKKAPPAVPATDATETTRADTSETVDVARDIDVTTTAGEAEEQTTPKRKKRRRRRRRPRAAEKVEDTGDEEPDDSEPSVKTRPAEKADAEDAVVDEPLDSDEDLDEDEDESEVETKDRGVPRAQRDLPTWEEAISYLIKPGQTEARSSDSGGSQGKQSRSKSGKGDSSRSSGRRSRRRR